MRASHSTCASPAAAASDPASSSTERERSDSPAACNASPRVDQDRRPLHSLRDQIGGATQQVHDRHDVAPSASGVSRGRETLDCAGAERRIGRVELDAASRMSPPARCL
jgi:hypothetical protein